MYVASSVEGPSAVDESRQIAQESLDIQVASLPGDHPCDDRTGLPMFLWKILVVGDSGVGKTALVKRWVHDIFTDKYKSTIGVDFALKELLFNNANVRLQLWDIAGQERFGNMTRVYYREAIAGVVVCDDRFATYTAVERWVDDIRKKQVLLPDGKRDLPLMMLINKADIPSGYSDQTWEQILEYASRLGFFAVAKVSAKTGESMGGALVDLCTHIARIQAYKKPEDVVRNDPPIRLEAGNGKLGDTELSTVTVIGDPYNAQSVDSFVAPANQRRRRPCCNT